MSRSSFYKCLQKNADFRDSLEKARSKAVMEVSNALYESARAGNVKAQIYFLRCRDPQNWNVTKRVELDVDFKRFFLSKNDIICKGREKGCLIRRP